MYIMLFIEFLIAFISVILHYSIVMIIAFIDIAFTFDTYFHLFLLIFNGLFFILLVYLLLVSLLKDPFKDFVYKTMNCLIIFKETIFSLLASSLLNKRRLQYL